MQKNPADVVGCQYRFWMLVSEFAPEARENLFDRDCERMWNIKEWDARWGRYLVSTDNPRGTGPHPAALAWRKHWKLPDWCLVRAEHAMSAVPSRQLQTKQIQDMEKWRKAVRHVECQLVDILQVNDARKEKAEWDGYVFGMKCPTRLIFPTLAYEIAITAPEWRR